MAGQDRARLVHDFWKQHGDEEPDEAMVEYFGGLLDDCEEEGVVEALDGFLCALPLPGFAALEEANRIEELLKLVEAAKPPKAAAPTQPATISLATSTSGAASTSGAPVAGAGQAPQLAAQLSGLRLQGSASSSSKTSTSGAGSDSRAASDQGSPLDADVSQLADLVGNNRDREFLASLLTRHGGLEGAVEWFLDAGPEVLQRQEAVFLAQRERDAEEQEDWAAIKEREKKAILEKFDLQAIKVVPAGTKKLPKQQVTTWSSGGEQATKVRYRDGQAVSFKGEKFIVEKIGEDWDGGSRGKVYTKGKRGKGFH